MTAALEVEVLGLKTPSASNLREHWSRRHKRVSQQRSAVWLALLRARPAQRIVRDRPAGLRALARKGGGAAALGPGPWRVELTRCSRGWRRLDDDNLRGALKAVRDEVADWLGVDDGDLERVSWSYAQQVRCVSWGVRIRIEGTEASR